MCIGRIIATPAKGITAQVIEVNTFEELKQLGEEKIKGKIVFFNHPFETKFINTFNAYGEAVEYRWRGPSEAARYGAVASIVRSMTLSQDDYPHTGAMHYADSVEKIPCCAISTNGANLLSSIMKADKKATFYLQMNCASLDSVLSYNVIGELRGKEFPDEYITVGGHLDSWETGDGAHDDGAGVVQSIEVIRTFKALGLRPKRTIRAVAFMNEENGTKGGRKYAAEAKRKNEKHIAALEADAGGTAPFGYGLEMSVEKKKKVKEWAPLFLPYNLWNFDEDHGGADISYLQKELEVPQFGLMVESQRYFDFHHAASDTFDKINKRELLLGAASLAAMIHLLCDHGL